MKKSFLVLTLLLMAVALNAQTLEEIVKKNCLANGTDKLQNATTIYLEGKMSQMGTEISMIMISKKPDLVKMVMSVNGMDIVTAFDGEKGWMINPMSGSFEATEIPAEQLDQIKGKNMFRNELQEQFDKGLLQLVGEENVNDKPAFKISVTSSASEKPTYLFIDKESSLLVKTTSTVNQMGQEMTVDAVITEYADVNGVKFPKVTETYINGTDAGSLVFDKIELDKVIEDSEFKINQ